MLVSPIKPIETDFHLGKTRFDPKRPEIYEGRDEDIPFQARHSAIFNIYNDVRESVSGGERLVSFGRGQFAGLIQSLIDQRRAFIADLLIKTTSLQMPDMPEFSGTYRFARDLHYFTHGMLLLAGRDPRFARDSAVVASVRQGIQRIFASGF